MCSLAALARGCRPAAKPCCLCWCCCCSCSWAKCLAARGSDGEPGKKPRGAGPHDAPCDGDAPPTLEEIRSWGQSFDRLMRSAAGRKVFRDFLRGEYSEENIMFWLACEELKRESDRDAVEEKARFIYEDYISILSPKEVSLDSRVREVVNRNMVEPTPHTFDEAQLQIYTLMHRDSYPRFVNSPLYKTLARLSNGSPSGAPAAPPAVTPTSCTSKVPNTLNCKATTPTAPNAPCVPNIPTDELNTPSCVSKAPSGGSTSPSSAPNMICTPSTPTQVAEATSEPATKEGASSKVGIDNDQAFALEDKRIATHEPDVQRSMRSPDVTYAPSRSPGVKSVSSRSSGATDAPGHSPGVTSLHGLTPVVVNASTHTLDNTNTIDRSSDEQNAQDHLNEVNAQTLSSDEIDVPSRSSDDKNAPERIADDINALSRSLDSKNAASRSLANVSANSTPNNQSVATSSPSVRSAGHADFPTASVGSSPE